MRNRTGISYFFLFGSVLLFAGFLLAQNVPDRALIVNGKSEGMVVQMGGHAYVDVETVAQFTNGSVTLGAHSSRAYLPGRLDRSGAPAPNLRPCRPRPRQACPGILPVWDRRLLAEMREWRGAVGTILTYGVPVVGTWPQDYHDRVRGKPRAGGGGCVNRGRPGRDAAPPERIFKPLPMGR